MHVGAPGSDLRVAHAGRARSAEADVRNEQLVPAASRKDTHRCLPAGRGGRDLRRDGAVEQASPVSHVAVVSGTDEHAGAYAARRRTAGDGGPALDHRLERAEAPGWLDELIEPVAHGDRRATIRAAGRPRRPSTSHDALPLAGRLRGSTLAPALVHENRIQRQTARPARGL